MDERVLTTIDAKGNATVLINRPDAHNALDQETVGQLSEALRLVEADTGVRAVVITGAGASFCAGADINQMKNSATLSPEQNFADSRSIAALFYTLYTLKKPTIARIHGAVRGGGLGLVAATDIAIAAYTATFRFSEVKLGIIPAMASPYVIAAIGERMARRYMVTGEEFTAAEAFRIGLVHETVEEKELDAAVGRMVAHVATSGPHAIPATKSLIAAVTRAPLNDETASETARRMADIRVTPEAQEGFAAFLGKRKANWTPGKG